MSEKNPTQLLVDASAWWASSITAIEPGRIAMRGYPIEELIGAIGFVEMMWLLLRSDLPTKEQARLLEATLVASVDHGPVAPSAAVARMAITCGLPVNGALASAINVLDDVHGGPAEQCMELYLEIAAEEGADVDTERAVGIVLQRWRERGGKFFPGFGHRFHPLDPRTPKILQQVDIAITSGAISGRFARIGRTVERALSAGRAKPIPMNVDGAQAIVFCELGFEPALGRGLFILSRVVGLLAHAWEQRQQGGRIKGPMPPSIPYEYTGTPLRPVPQRG
ncbi:MAG TPA: citryl-CoA lyase [Casimicrobiaceae bacterium]|nr:citryl-CoA lyase [Casimicrobiaceae bacterium]